MSAHDAIRAGSLRLQRNPERQRVQGDRQAGKLSKAEERIMVGSGNQSHADVFKPKEAMGEGCAEGKGSLRHQFSCVRNTRTPSKRHPL